MTAAIVPLANLLLFAFGAVLYGMLAVMVARFPVSANGENSRGVTSFDWLLLATGIFGFAWNAVNVIEFFWRDFLNAPFSPYLSVIAFSALGFLPAVAVQSAQNFKESKFKTFALAAAAYAMSVLPAGAHFYCVVNNYSAPFVFGLRILTVGYSIVLGALFFAGFRKASGRRALLICALAVFTVSAFHLSQPHSGSMTEKSLLAELIGHHAGLLLALVILYQDFRFAFADLFLKRALSLFLLIAAAFVLYLFVGAPLVALHADHPPSDSIVVASNLALWTATALAYPKIYQLAAWLIDKLLRRADYEKLRTKIMLKLATLEAIESVLEETSRELQTALTADSSAVEEFYDSSSVATPAAPSLSLVSFEQNKAEIFIPTVDEPHYKIILHDFRGGRRLLSGETELLKDVALAAARRIDALRHTHERCEMEIREQQFVNLATEAELRALRAQINPHFLFNALTTIGYLIEYAPRRALDTLLRLTKLLRGVLHSGGEFITLGEEIKLIEAYLEIEQARFEERLTVEIKVAPKTEIIRIPALILQPIVENAIKHGITPKKEGGRVIINARREKNNLILEVSDTGAGIDADELEKRKLARVGLKNVEQRLRLHYNGASRMHLAGEAGAGMRVRIEIDLKKAEKTVSEIDAAAAAAKASNGNTVSLRA